MGLSDYLKYVKKAKVALQGDKGQQILNKAGNVASKATGGRYDDKIQKARDAADRALGNDDKPDDPRA